MIKYKCDLGITYKSGKFEWKQSLHKSGNESGLHINYYFNK
jgi:hypothetical protein